MIGCSSLNNFCTPLQAKLALLLWLERTTKCLQYQLSRCLSDINWLTIYWKIAIDFNSIHADSLMVNIKFNWCSIHIIQVFELTYFIQAELMKMICWISLVSLLMSSAAIGCSRLSLHDLVFGCSGAACRMRVYKSTRIGLSSSRVRLRLRKRRRRVRRWRRPASARPFPLSLTRTCSTSQGSTHNLGTSPCNRTPTLNSLPRSRLLTTPTLSINSLECQVHRLQIIYSDKHANYVSC